MIHFLDYDNVVKIHEKIFTISSGLIGVHKERLESILSRIVQYHLYKEVNDIISLAAIYVIAIAQGHPFVDGNKRTAFISMITFLNLNGFDLVETKNSEDFIVSIACKEISYDKVKLWIEKRSKEIY